MRDTFFNFSTTLRFNYGIYIHTYKHTPAWYIKYVYMRKVNPHSHPPGRHWVCNNITDYNFYSGILSCVYIYIKENYTILSGCTCTSSIIIRPPPGWCVCHRCCWSKEEMMKDESAWLTFLSSNLFISWEGWCLELKRGGYFYWKGYLGCGRRLSWVTEYNMAC